jgi:hypothetical protein
VADPDPDNAVLPLMDGTCIRVRDAQAVVGLLLVKATEQQQQVQNENAVEMIRVLEGLEKEARPPRSDDRIRAAEAGQRAFLKLILELAKQLEHMLSVTCIQCGSQLSADSDDAQLELTADGEAAFYCTDCRSSKTAN